MKCLENVLNKEKAKYFSLYLIESILLVVLHRLFQVNKTFWLCL